VMSTRSSKPGVPSYAASLIALGFISLVMVVVRDRAWTVQATGAEILPLLDVLPFVTLATIAAIVATAGRLRQLIGLALIGLASWTLIQLSMLATAQVQWWPWPVLALLGVTALFAIGVLTTTRSRAWPTLGSKYQRTTPLTNSVDRADVELGSGASSPQDQWREMDEGRDPTL
jgi:hypothetical protein